VFDNYNNDNFCAAAREARATRAPRAKLPHGKAVRAPASLALQGCKARAKRARCRRELGYYASKCYTNQVFILIHFLFTIKEITSRAPLAA